MNTNEHYLPEGSHPTPSAYTLPQLRQACDSGSVLEATAQRCTASHELIFDLGAAIGRMPRENCALGITEGTTRDIAILSRVGKPTCFRVLRFDETASPPIALLSRAVVQQQAREMLFAQLRPGDVIPARVTHLEPFGAFVDIGCGFPSLIGIEALSVSRIRHPSDRLRVGQHILAVVRGLDFENKRVLLSHRELLGTWQQNAACFSPGETVRGIVRSIEPYGVFIELAPNLSGLAEPREPLTVGQHVSVFIKSILPARMKIKLNVIDTLPPRAPAPLHYFVTEAHLSRWVYTPPSCTKRPVETIFEA